MKTIEKDSIIEDMVIKVNQILKNHQIPVHVILYCYRKKARQTSFTNQKDQIQIKEEEV